jgi:hypothetical protein
MCAALRKSTGDSHSAEAEIDFFHDIPGNSGGSTVSSISCSQKIDGGKKR